MAYTPYYSGGWQSGEEGDTPITPAALNHMEEGIEDANAGTTRTAYTPQISCSGNTAFAADNVSFYYYKSGNTLRVNGRFSIANIGNGTGGPRISLPSGMTAMGMGVGSVGYYDAGNQVEHGFIRTVNATTGSTEVMLYHNAGGSATTPARLGAGTFVNVDFTVYLE